jgi:hypothetical protein
VFDQFNDVGFVLWPRFEYLTNCPASEISFSRAELGLVEIPCGIGTALCNRLWHPSGCSSNEHPLRLSFTVSSHRPLANGLRRRPHPGVDHIRHHDVAIGRVGNTWLLTAVHPTRCGVLCRARISTALVNVSSRPDVPVFSRSRYAPLLRTPIRSCIRGLPQSESRLRQTGFMSYWDPLARRGCTPQPECQQLSSTSMLSESRIRDP